MAFIPIAVPHRNEKFRLIIGVLLIILGLFAAVSGLTIPREAIDAATISPDALASGRHYYIEDAVILDQFGYTEEDGKTTSYECAVAFGMANDEWVITAIKVPLSSALFSSVMDYLNDSSQNVGDLRMAMYVGASTLDSEFSTFLDSYIEEALGPYSADYTTVKFELKYRGADEAAYKKSVDSDRLAMLAVGAVMIVLGGLLFGLGLGQRRQRLEALQSADGNADESAW